MVDQHHTTFYTEPTTLPSSSCSGVGWGREKSDGRIAWGIESFPQPTLAYKKFNLILLAKLQLWGLLWYWGYCHQSWKTTHPPRRPNNHLHGLTQVTNSIYVAPWSMANSTNILYKSHELCNIYIYNEIFNCIMYSNLNRSQTFCRKEAASLNIAWALALSTSQESKSK